MHDRSALATTGSSFAFISAMRSAQLTTEPSATVTSNGRRHHPTVHTTAGPSTLQSLSTEHSTTQTATGETQADVDGSKVGHVAAGASPVQLLGATHWFEQMPHRHSKPAEQPEVPRQTSKSFPPADVVVIVPAAPVAPAVPVAPADPVTPVVPAEPATPPTDAPPSTVRGRVPHASVVTAQTTDNDKPIDERMGVTSSRSWT
jgi:hypothetical protein